MKLCLRDTPHLTVAMALDSAHLTDSVLLVERHEIFLPYFSLSLLSVGLSLSELVPDLHVDLLKLQVEPIKFADHSGLRTKGLKALALVSDVGFVVPWPLDRRKTDY